MIEGLHHIIYPFSGEVKDFPHSHVHIPDDFLGCFPFIITYLADCLLLLLNTDVFSLKVSVYYKCKCKSCVTVQTTTI